MKKLMYIGIGIIVLLTILVLTGRKSVHHEITINATPDQVWKVLTNTDKYPEWNPVMQLLQGELKEGKKVIYRFTQESTKPYDIPATVKKVEEGQLLNQMGGTWGILTYDHRYHLEKFGNSTKVTIHEDYKGMGVHFWNPGPVQKAYAQLNQALKKRVESLPGPSEE